MSLTLNRFNALPVYEIIKLNVDETTQESSLTILLRLPTDENPIVTTIKMPFTSIEPWQKYTKPPHTFRDRISVFQNADLLERVNIMGKIRCMGLDIRFAEQCEYDNWIYKAALIDADYKKQTGYTVWSTINEYVENL